MTGSVIATIAAAAILIFFMIWGYSKGFLRLLISTFALVVTVSVAAFLTPHVSSLLKNTFVGKNIDSRVEESVDRVEGIDLIDSITSAQGEVVKNLPLPDVMKDTLEGNRQESGAGLEGNEKFSDFIKNSLSGIGLNIISYILVGVLIYVLIRVILVIARVLTRLPVIGVINRILGALLGLVQGLIILWILCLVIILISPTDFGMQLTEIIKENAFLRLIYEHNGILILADKMFGSFI